jgi:hypothetical protein
MSTKGLDDLLESIIADTIAEAEGPLRRPEPEKPDPALKPTAEELQGPRRWAHDPNVRNDIAGVQVGHGFKMQDCGPDLDGDWEVVRLELSHPDINQRFLTAKRPGGGPPYIKMSEIDFLDELMQGRVVVAR